LPVPVVAGTTNLAAAMTARAWGMAQRVIDRSESAGPNSGAASELPISLTPKLSGRAQARVAGRVDDRGWHFIHVRSAPTNVRSQLAVRSVYATEGSIGIPARRGSVQGWKRAVITTVTQRYRQRSRRNNECHGNWHGARSDIPAADLFWHQGHLLVVPRCPGSEI
jgi:hypothetical protein